MTRWKTLLAAFVLALIPILPLLAWAASDTSDAHRDAWLRAMKPGAPHAQLAELAGEWSYSITYWNGPGAEAQTIEGTAVKQMILGGRYLEETLTGEFLGRPLRGLGITGYDNVTREYVAIWLDNAGTTIGVYRGKGSDKGVRTLTSTMHEPVTGSPLAVRTAMRVVDGDHHTFESYLTLPDGTEFLHMRVEYTRVSS
jgi:hypothetical protein